ncbi:MAG: hypothetical protein AABZ06_07705 [Bdellovibrionota bacterium]
MKKILVLSVVVLSIVAFGCGARCKEAQEKILLPMQNTVTYLDTNPDGSALAGSGCAFITDQLKGFPNGAATIRKIADSKFSDTFSRCLQWETSMRYVCHGSQYGSPIGCYLERYTYCAKWEYNTVHNPGYQETMDFAHHLDLAYDRAHKMCVQASMGNHDQAYQESRDLLLFLKGDLVPEGNRVYAMACNALEIK